MSRFHLVAAALIVGELGPAHALEAQQQDSLGYVHPEFMERSYFFKNIPDSRTLDYYEAFLALHLPFRQKLQETYDKVLAMPGPHHTVAVFGSMSVNLRQTQEESAPVRTPSYMPKLTVTYYRVQQVEPDPPSPLSKEPRVVSLLTIPFVPYGHYSNGQDGCLFESQARQGEDCVDTATVARPRSVNRHDGSFSSHYMELGIYYRRIALDSVFGAGSRVGARSYWSIGGHVRSSEVYNGLGGSMSKELRDAYGPLRVRLLGQWVGQRNGRFWGPGQRRFEGFVELIPGHPDEVPPVRVSVEAARTMDKRGGWGVFARVYTGQDDYNLGFLTRITVLQLGATISQERMPSFHQ